MDFDQNHGIPMGSDGCIDMDHADNSGLPQDVWCDGCPLTEVYNNNFAHISKADFWIAAGNAVIRQSSDNALDLKSTYMSGRVDAESCVDQGLRLPAASGCDAVEGVFVERMGLTLTDGVALLGAHTIGRANELFSGHHGIWVDTEAQSTVSSYLLYMFHMLNLSYSINTYLLIYYRCLISATTKSFSDVLGFLETKTLQFKIGLGEVTMETVLASS